MRKLTCLIMAFLLLTCFPGNAFAKSSEAMIMDCTSALLEMAAQKDAGEMGNLLKKAKGVAIFPSIVKAGLIFGAEYGEGLILKRDSKSGKWYGPNFIYATGGSWGLQIGVESTALVLVIINDKGMKGFMGDKLTLGGEISVAAGPVGRETSAATDEKLEASIYSYSMSKGLFAGVSLKGVSINTDKKTNKDYWKKDTTPASVLSTVAGDSRIIPLINAIKKVTKK